MRIIAWVLLGLCIAATVVPIGFRPHMAMPADADRALAFTVLGMAFGLAHPRRWLTICLFLVLAAFSIESLQFFSPSRHPALPDAIIKALGAVFGVVLAHGVLRLLRLRHQA
ncbi:VanZ family protein [Rhizobium glycinendophyticum]|uniref:VanZ family protein n=1 Tax=Rhizobium glycinendophyticum TaxID=2589807 RepID=UPI0013758CE5|nr:VanZ family protein [Rhizobium glycinendophyticum]